MTEPNGQPNDQPAESVILKRYYELRQYVGIDMVDLEGDFMKLPQVLEDIGELVARAVNIENVAKHVLDIAEAEAGERLREASRGISEARVKTMVPLDHEVQEARNAVDKAHFETQVVAGLYTSIKEQARLLGKAADMIISGYITPHVLHSQRRAEIRAARVAADGGTAKAKTLERPS